MKKLLLILLGIMLVTSQVKAQFEKGTKHWGATIDFSRDQSKFENFPASEYKIKQSAVNPSVQAGWMFADNRMFGLRLGADLAWNKSRSTGLGYDFENSTFGSAYSLSPFLRQYKTISRRWAIFLHSGLDLTYYRTTSESPVEKTHSNGYGAGLFVVPGISFSVTPRFSIEADVNLLSLGLAYQHNEDVNHVSFNAGITSSIQQSFALRAAWYLH